MIPRTVEVPSDIKSLITWKRETTGKEHANGKVTVEFVNRVYIAGVPAYEIQTDQNGPHRFEALCLDTLEVVILDFTKCGTLT